MKHYANEKGIDIDLIRCRRSVSDKAPTGEVKRIYRQRERAALKRMTAELPQEWERTPEEERYWERKMAEHMAEYERLCDAEEYRYFMGDEPGEFLLNAMRVECRLFRGAWNEMEAA